MTCVLTSVVSAGRGLTSLPVSAQSEAPRTKHNMALRMSAAPITALTTLKPQPWLASNQDHDPTATKKASAEAPPNNDGVA